MDSNILIQYGYNQGVIDMYDKLTEAFTLSQEQGDISPAKFVELVSNGVMELNENANIKSAELALELFNDKPEN